MWFRGVGLIMTFILSLLATPRTAEAQPAAKVPRLGFLGIASPASSEPSIEAFRQGMRVFGWVEGHNITIEFRWAEGEFAQLPAFTAALSRLEVDVLVTQGTPAAIAAKNATQTIPIVFVQVGDPVGSRLITSLARPGVNLTGLSLGVSSLNELEGKRLEILKETIPTV
jgi:putative tryptophan/tyrosine transport system substrate-binding protein